MERHLGVVGMVLTIGGGLMLFVADWIGRRVAKRTGACAADSEPKFAPYGIPVLLFGLAIWTSAPLVPHVEGTVAARRHGKGNQFRMDVDTARGRFEIVGESGTFDRCAEGHHVRKAAWTTAYDCDGTRVGTGSVGIYLAIAFETALGVLGIVGLKQVGKRRR